MKTLLRRKRGDYIAEGKDFWREHVLAFSGSGLRKASYCRANGINYTRFNYWEKVLSDKGSNAASPEKSSVVGNFSRLLPVEVKGDAASIKVNALGLCSLEFKNGIVLQIHEEQALGFILGRLS